MSPRPRFVTGITHHWGNGLLDPTCPQATLPQTAEYPTVTSRDPAAMWRTNASCVLSPIALTRLASVRPVRSPHRGAEHRELCRLDEAAARSEEGEAADLEALTGLGVHCGGGVLEGGVEGEAGAPV